MTRIDPIFQILFYIFFLFGMNAQSSLDTLFTKLENSTTDTQRVRLFIDISESLADNAQIDSSYYYANRAIDLAVDINDLLLQAKAYYTLGYAYDLSGQLGQALSNYEDSRKIYEDLGIKDEVATCMNSKGVAAYFQGDFEKALSYYLEALDYTEKYDLQAVMANVLNNLGVAYRVTGKNREAINIYYKTLALSKKTDNKNMVATSYHNLGVAYNFEAVLDTALTYFDSAIYQYEKVGNLHERARTTTAIGEAYYFTGKDYDQARKFLKLGEARYDDTYADQEMLSKIYLLLAQVERDDGRYDESTYYFDKCYDIIKDTDRQEVKLDFFDQVEQLYSKLNQYDKAYESLSKYVNLLKEIQTNEKLQAIEELQTKYETKEKEQAIEILNSQNLIAANQLKNNRIIGAILVIGLIGLSGLIFWMNKLNNKLKKSSDEKETLLREIHHRVKNNLQVISALLTLQSKYIKDDQAIEALREGQDRVQSMALIHKDLYQHDNLKGVNTKDYLEKLIDNLIDSYNINSDKIELIMDIESIWLDVDTMIPMGLMINELVSNALKHAFTDQEDARLAIFLNEEGQSLKLKIEDNGRGFKEMENIGSQTFGQSLINSFAKKLNADINYINSSGLTIEIDIKDYEKAA